MRFFSDIQRCITWRARCVSSEHFFGACSFLAFYSEASCEVDAVNTAGAAARVWHCCFASALGGEQGIGVSVKSAPGYKEPARLACGRRGVVSVAPSRQAKEEIAWAKKTVKKEGIDKHQACRGGTTRVVGRQASRTPNLGQPGARLIEEHRNWVRGALRKAAMPRYCFW